MFSAWAPKLSGCYRPRYFSSTSSPEAENSKVREEQPITLMVSDRSYAATDAGYDQGKVKLHIFRKFLSFQISNSSISYNN